MPRRKSVTEQLLIDSLEQLSDHLNGTNPRLACLIMRGFASLDNTLINQKTFWTLSNLHYKRIVISSDHNTSPSKINGMQKGSPKRTLPTAYLTRSIPSSPHDVRAQHSQAMTERYHRKFRRTIDFTDFIRHFSEALRSVPDPLLAVLALQGLADVSDNKLSPSLDSFKEEFRGYLRKWRNESTLRGAYQKDEKVKESLKGLTVFRMLKMPLFIDNFGEKTILADYREILKDFSTDSHPAIILIEINGDTKLCHVTHWDQAVNIRRQKRFKPSDNKNSIPGIWFSKDADESVYGSWKFTTTLSKLGITGLRQGEVVRYKREINVILYADNNATFDGLKQPSEELIIRKHDDENSNILNTDPKTKAKARAKANAKPYVHWSIFIPARYTDQLDLPVALDDGMRLVPVNHNHYTCVLKMRYKCPDDK